MNHETAMILAQEPADKVYTRELAGDKAEEFRAVGVATLVAGNTKIAAGWGFKKPFEMRSRRRQ